MLGHYQLCKSSPTYLVHASSGKRAGSVGSRCKYSKMAHNGKMYQTHRVVYCIANNVTMDSIEGFMVDHKDGNKANNGPTNLRLTDSRGNMGNLKSHREGRLVGAHKHGSRWRSRIEVDGKTISLGCFDTEEQAHCAYVAYLDKLPA